MLKYKKYIKEVYALEKLIVLGTGWAMSEKLFNTSFILENEKKEKLLVDTGGGNGILSRLEDANVDLGEIHHLFITHKHTDHILGILWIIRKLEFNYIRRGKYEGKLTIYCHSELEEIIRGLCKLTLKQRFIDLLDDVIVFRNVKDKEIVNVNGYDLKIIDIHGKTTLQYGFKTTLNNGKSFIFLGDETLKEEVYDEVRDVDYMCHDADCIGDDEEKYTPEKFSHTTSKKATQFAEMLNVKNLILWHTKDFDLKNRQKKFTDDAKKYFKGNVIVPNDLDIIEL